ncbi:DUF4184 family protein [Nannocystis sp. SCPEA4]|uniref:DUF4184 family protein n=1 Tax=Nannocystis sp. SCPEA4 TaxID=2996787 RepID=UPI00226F5C69|nr:DUF4184 family protein [Nannocystis sp. SCPEA4]
MLHDERRDDVGVKLERTSPDAWSDITAERLWSPATVRYQTDGAAGMPLTFPSHAAAILPLLHLGGRRRLPATALVVGSGAPDLVYLVGTLGAAAHHPRGLLTICLPAGLLAFLYLEALVLPIAGPLVVAAWPSRGRSTVARLVGPRPLRRTPGEWFAVAVALVLGAATHQLWDGFTHAWMWPASALYPETSVSLFGRPVLVARVVQHASSAIGLAIVLIYLWRTAPPPLPPPERGDAARRLLALLAIPLVGGCVAAVVASRVPDPLITRALWNTAWSAAAWFALLLGAACLLARALRREQG